MSKISKVVLAYSGGLDTSAIIPWLKENYDCEVIAFVADVGQGEEELVGIEEKAIASGAIKCIVADLKEEMVADYIYPSLKSFESWRRCRFIHDVHLVQKVSWNGIAPEHSIYPITPRFVVATANIGQCLAMVFIA